MDNTRIREIERVIDDYHKSHKAFTGTKEQMTYDLLTAYGDLCICTASVIRQTPEGIIKYITSVNGINESTIKRIVDYITYDSSKKNMDIMYQPLVRVSENTLLIAPMLFIGSNPERNLLSLVSLNNNDDTYSKEVNDLEDLSNGLQGATSGIKKQVV